MPGFDYEGAKKEIAQILAVVKTVPEPLQEKCFELLFNMVYAGHHARKREHKLDAATDEVLTLPPPPAVVEPARKLPPNVIAFTRKYNVTPDELGKLFILDHEPLLPIYKLPPGNQTQAQLYKVMMVLLENGLLNNSLSAPYPELRENIKQEGLLDGNFNGALKRNHSLFKGAITKSSIKEEGLVELTGAGMQRLAEIVKELGQPS